MLTYDNFYWIYKRYTKEYLLWLVEKSHMSSERTSQDGRQRLFWLFLFFHIGSKETAATLLLSSSVTLNNFTKLNEEASTWCTEG